MTIPSPAAPKTSLRISCDRFRDWVSPQSAAISRKWPTSIQPSLSALPGFTKKDLGISHVTWRCEHFYQYHSIFLRDLFPFLKSLKIEYVHHPVDTVKVLLPELRRLWLGLGIRVAYYEDFLGIVFGFPSNYVQFGWMGLNGEFWFIIFLVNEVSGELRPPKWKVSGWRLLDWPGLAAALEVVAFGGCQVSDARSRGWRRHLLDPFSSRTGFSMGSLGDTRGIGGFEHIWTLLAQLRRVHSGFNTFKKSEPTGHAKLSAPGLNSRIFSLTLTSPGGRNWVRASSEASWTGSDLGPTSCDFAWNVWREISMNRFSSCCGSGWSNVLHLMQGDGGWRKKQMMRMYSGSLDHQTKRISST